MSDDLSVRIVPLLPLGEPVTFASHVSVIRTSPARCPDCEGSGEVGMYRSGLAIVCERCKGKGEIMI
jgi:hypothetical protein